jgi:hypothetical protein
VVRVDSPHQGDGLALVPFFCASIVLNCDAWDVPPLVVGFHPLSIVNFDNNQHGSNEDVRIKSVWDGIDSMAALLTIP